MQSIAFFPESHELTRVAISPRTAPEVGMSETRKIAAILAADVVGYSRLAGKTKIVHLRGFGPSVAI